MPGVVQGRLLLTSSRATYREVETGMGSWESLVGSRPPITADEPRNVFENFLVVGIQ
jgi:hypothetical protein